MRGDMVALRSAANALVDKIFGEQTSNPNVTISLVPFAGRVSIEDYNSGWMISESEAPVEDVKEEGSSGKGGKDDDKKGRKGGGKGGGKDADYTMTDRCTDLRSDPHYETDAPPSVERFPLYADPDKNGTCPDARMIALTGDRAKIQNAINALTNTHGTSTHIGLLWGWRSLSPKWQGVWYPDDPTIPRSWSDTPGKVLVIMTDGKNNPHQAGDDDKYGHEENTVNAQLLRQCTQMREEGYSLFAVMYKVDLRNLYVACTGDAEKVFTANSAGELHSAFESIGTSLVHSALRLTR